MEVKNIILSRVYLSYLLIIFICVAVIGKAFYIQQVQGGYWKGMSDSLHQKMQTLDASRGTIYSQDGQMLSTSIPQFDIYIDFAADGLREKNGRRFRENLDSLCYYLGKTFPEKTATDYKQALEYGYRKELRYYPLLKKVSFRDYQKLQKFPLVKEGRNKSGFIPEVKNIRLNPYGMLGIRTIGLNRENSSNVGLELTYDSILRGKEGKRLVRFIAGGVAVPVEDANEIDPKDGKDIITTLDIKMQEIVENALMKMMVDNECQKGTAIVMEVKTGKVKAIANLDRTPNGNYAEIYNNAITPTEPGSTFKIASMLSVLEDGKTDTGKTVNMEGGRWLINKRTVYDSENHGHVATVKKAFEMSSNVASAKLVYNAYGSNPNLFIDHLRNLGFAEKTGLDLVGERDPVIHTPGSKMWSATTLPWMAFGYSLTVSPMHITMLYNSIANDGKMMRPYLVDAISTDGVITEQKYPHEVRKISGPEVTGKLQAMLEGVCNIPGGTGYRLMQDVPFKVAGKTGTALVAQGPLGYNAGIYQSSFAGYFPADNPEYTCVVVIINKPRAAKYYGAAVAGPVFKEIAQRLYTMYIRRDGNEQNNGLDSLKSENSNYYFAGGVNDFHTIFKTLGINYVDSATVEKQFALVNGINKPVLKNLNYLKGNRMPNLVGLGLKDALYLCESRGLKVYIDGVGKVVTQSILTGDPVEAGQQIKIMLN